MSFPAGVQIKADLKERLLTLDTTEPIPFRKQNFGDYTMPELQLKPGLEQEGETGFSIHQRAPKATGKRSA
jgi:NAD(P)H dehydrogenase (quinone)